MDKTTGITELFFPANFYIYYKCFYSSFLTWITFSSGLYSQKFKKTIDYRFKDFEMGYISFFSKGDQFPITSLEKGTFAKQIIKVLKLKLIKL
jgi:hypothetical protein